MNSPRWDQGELFNSARLPDLSEFAPLAHQKKENLELPLGEHVQSDTTFRWLNSGLAFAGGAVQTTTPPCPVEPSESNFMDLVEKGEVDSRYFLSPNAAEGIIRRVDSQNRTLFKPLRAALESLVHTQLGGSMSKFAALRLGKTSVDDIRTIDAKRGVLDEPLVLKVECKQVTAEVEAGTLLFIWLGSDNDKGGETDWDKGFRAIGSVLAKDGGPAYNDDWEVTVEIKLVLNRSLDHLDFLKYSAQAFYWFSKIPILGMTSYANQTFQVIHDGHPLANVRALLYTVSRVLPSFKEDLESTYPELLEMLAYQPPNPLAGAPVEDEDDEGTEVTIDSLLPAFCSALDAANFRMDRLFVRRFLASLLTKPLVILTGQTGSGKSRLAQALAHWLSPDPDTPDELLCFVAVEAGWDSGHDLVGFPDSLRADSKGYIKPGHGLLDHLIEAGGNGEKPHFLVLDEMNLSHVERYFAQFLSALESGVAIPLHGGEDNWEDNIPPQLSLSGNVFIVGTVNVDETTYLFSPKVLDRANVLEFAVSADDIGVYLDGASDLDLSGLAGLGAEFGSAIVSEASKADVNNIPMIVRNGHIVLDNGDGPGEGEQTLKAKLKEDLVRLHQELDKVGAAFGYRVVKEIQRYFYYYLILDPEQASYSDVLDYQVHQKLLPRLHGSARKLSPVLQALSVICDELELPTSAAKVARMSASLSRNGFASFAEA